MRFRPEPYEVPRSESAPPKSAGLSETDAVAAMVSWFNDNYEDPTYWVPLLNEPRVHHWDLFGGPFRAVDVLHRVFSASVPPDWIEKAAQTAEAPNGQRLWRVPQWSPHRKRFPSMDAPAAIRYSDGATHSDGSGFRNGPSLEDIEAGKAAIREAIREIKPHLETWAGRAAGIGHNNPPEPIADGTITVAEIDQVASALNEVDEEIERAKPEMAVLERAWKGCERLAERVRAWVTSAGKAGAELLRDQSEKARKDPIVFVGVLGAAAEAIRLFVSLFT